jgi:ABC-type phosphate/phosphonate transport system substrate-binding protein
MQVTRHLGAVLLLTLATTGPASADLVLSAPPRESAAEAQAFYTPLAEYLTKVMGTPVVFKWSDNWLTYQSAMLKDQYDIVMDGPHFVSWRMAKFQHEPVVKLPGNLSYVVIVRKDETKVNDLIAAAGHPMCTASPPNLGALTILYQFTNPARQPLLVNTKGFHQAYSGLLEKKCVAAVMPVGVYATEDKDGVATKVIFHSKPLPNQAISASSRISPAMRTKLRDALMSPEGKAATAKLRTEYNNKDFVPATHEEYEGLADLLRDTWGFAL